MRLFVVLRVLDPEKCLATSSETGVAEKLTLKMIFYDSRSLCTYFCSATKFALDRTT